MFYRVLNLPLAVITDKKKLRFYFFSLFKPLRLTYSKAHYALIIYTPKLDLPILFQKLEIFQELNSETLNLELQINRFREYTILLRFHYLITLSSLRYSNSSGLSFGCHIVTLALKVLNLIGFDFSLKESIKT